MKPVIIVENVSKKFSRNANAHLDYGIRDLMNELLGRSRTTQLRQDEFIAVNDLSFALYPGDSLALIGRNGSGKTTTLKMLNGTLKPDAGKIIINGRVQSLISLGTGFNHQLSGRENIYNTTSLLGLSRKETGSILDEVIDFSELDDFIDSPVQTYSSGMKARLGFSIAVHLKPEILLIDEILAVGDYAFKTKCYARMTQLKNDGVTIVLVSHNHQAIMQLCEQTLWLNHGKAIETGQTKNVVKNYLAFLDEQECQSVNSAQKNPKKKEVRNERKKKPQSTIYGPFIYNSFDYIEDLEVSLRGQDSRTDREIKAHDQLIIEYSFRLRQQIKNLCVNLAFYRKDDSLMYGAISTLNGDILKHTHTGHVRCRITIPDFNLKPDRYVLLMAILEGYHFLYRNVVKEFVVTGNGNLTWGFIDFTCHYEVLM